MRLIKRYYVAESNPNIHKYCTFSGKLFGLYSPTYNCYYRVNDETNEN